MSVTEHLRQLAHHGYPASGVPAGEEYFNGEPFGPGGDTSLTGAARPATLHGFSLPPVQPTETQAAQAETRALSLVRGGAPGDPAAVPASAPRADVGSLPVLTPGQIAAHRAGTVRRAGGASTQPARVSRRAPATAAVERPELTGTDHAPAPATTEVPRGAYPATRTRAKRSSKDVLRSIIRGEAAPTAPMRVVDRLTATPFQHVRRHGDGSDRQARRTLNFALRLAETMFHYGADALDVENAIIAVCATYGVENLEVDITNQSVTINYVAETTASGKLVATGRGRPAGSTTAGPATGALPRGAGGKDSGGNPGPRTSQDVLDDPNTFSHTVMRVVRSWTDNYAGLANSHQLVTRIIEGNTPLRDAERELSAINSRPKPYPKWVVWLATVVASATITVAIGGGPNGALVASVSSILVQAVSAKLGSWRIPEFFALAANALIVTLAAMAMSALGVELSPPRVIAGGIIMLLPTTRMVSTMQDAINGFPVTAAGRLLSTALAFLGIIAGISVGVSVSGYWGVPRVDVTQSSFTPAGAATNIVFMLISTALIGVTMQAKPRHLLPAVTAAFAGLLVYHAGSALGVGARLDTGLGAVTSGCVAALLAARARIPQTVLAIPAMTYLLPGLSIFRGMYAITVEGDTTGTGSTGLVNAMASIVLLASGVVLGKYLMRPFLERMQAVTQRRNRRR